MFFCCYVVFCFLNLIFSSMFFLVLHWSDICFPCDLLFVLEKKDLLGSVGRLEFKNCLIGFIFDFLCSRGFKLYTFLLLSRCAGNCHLSRSLRSASSRWIHIVRLGFKLIHFFLYIGSMFSYNFLMQFLCLVSWTISSSRCHFYLIFLLRAYYWLLRFQSCI